MTALGNDSPSVKRDETVSRSLPPSLPRHDPRHDAVITARHANVHQRPIAP